MKYLVLAFSCFLLSCANEPPPPVHYLEGDWIRTNGEVGELTTEHWHKTDSTFEGEGFRYKNDSLVFSEKMSISKEGDAYFLTVNGVNPQPTSFKFYQWTTHSFTCTNPENDYPKTITYTFTKDSMIARVGDGVRSMTYHFIRIKP